MATLSIFTIIQLLAIGIFSRAIYRHFLHPLAIYPGPFLAGITNIWKFYHYFRGNLHVVEQSLHQRHGPIIRTGPNSLSFASPAAFESIYGFNHGFEKGDFYAFARDSTTGASNIFSARTHAEHRDARRKVVGSSLTSSHIQSYRPVIVKYVQHFTSKLAAAIPKSKNGVLNVAGPIHELTFNTLAEIIYGPSLSDEPWSETTNGEGVLTAFRTMSKFAWGSSLVPFLSWLMSTGPMVKLSRKPTTNEAGIPTGIAAIAARTKLLILEDYNLVVQVEQPSIAKSMLAMERRDSRCMDLDTVWRECFNLLFAGPGSTAAAVTGVLERLGSEEGIPWQLKIRNELKQVDNRGESRILNAVVRESMRYSAPFPTAFPREVRPGAENAIPGLDKSLPVGTLVSSNSWIVSHDKDTWGGEASAWNPERWLDTEGEVEKKSLDDTFVVFSKGPRGCVGKDIAMLLMTEAVASVISKYRIEKMGELKGNGWLEMQIERCDLKFTKI